MGVFIILSVFKKNQYVILKKKNLKMWACETCNLIKLTLRELSKLYLWHGKI